MIEVSSAHEATGGSAAQAQLLGKFGPVNVSAAALIANDFHLQGGREQSIRDGAVALDAPIKVGRTVLPAHVEAHVTDLMDGTTQLEAAARLSASIDRFNLAAAVGYTRQYLRGVPSPPGELNLDFIGSGHVGPVRIRGETNFDVSPAARFRGPKSRLTGRHRKMPIGKGRSPMTATNTAPGRTSPTSAGSEPWPLR